MKAKYPLPLLIFFFITISLNAQWVKFDKKEVAFLKNVDTVSVLVTFNDLHFNADNLNENDFLEHISQKIKKHLNNTEAENWKAEYYNSKREFWPKAFVNTLNETTALYKNAPVFVLNKPNAKYELRVNAFWMYFGYQAIAHTEPAKLHLSMDLSEVESKKIISSLRIKETLGLVVPKPEFPKVSLKSMENAFERAAENLGLSLKKVVK
jgi:hypothetical protein